MGVLCTQDSNALVYRGRWRKKAVAVKVRLSSDLWFMQPSLTSLRKQMYGQTFSCMHYHQLLLTPQQSIVACKWLALTKIFRNFEVKEFKEDDRGMTHCREAPTEASHVPRNTHTQIRVVVMAGDRGQAGGLHPCSSFRSRLCAQGGRALPGFGPPQHHDHLQDCDRKRTR